MAMPINTRVYVTDQNSQYRNHLGTVKRVVEGDDADTYVRIDGHEAAGAILFKESSLGPTTLASPIDYGPEPVEEEAR